MEGGEKYSNTARRERLFFRVFVEIVADLSPGGTEPSHTVRTECRPFLSVLSGHYTNDPACFYRTLLQKRTLPTRNRQTVGCVNGLLTGPEETKRKGLLPFNTISKAL